MLESISFNSKKILYYDKDAQTIARKPTNSNLLEISSDNSLYCGVTTSEKNVKILCEIFGLKKILDFEGKKFIMNGYGITCEVVLHISKQQQIQIRVGKDNVMHDLFNAYLLKEMNDEITNEDVLIVLDFKNNNIRFKKIKEMEL